MTPKATAHPLPDNRLDSPADKKSRKFTMLLPVSFFMLIVLLLGIGLTLDPRTVPSPLIDKSAPVFSLPPVQGRTLGLASTDLGQEVSLVNVFASWCVACRQEHPLLMDLSRRDIVPIHGLNYKDPPQDAAAWLGSLGDPYIRTGADIDGRVGIDWGVYGVPETFVIDKRGRIAYKHIGPISQKDWDETLRPLIDQLNGQGD